MKKTALILALILISSLFVTVYAADDGFKVYVSICDSEGKLALALEEIKVRDADGDGKITINDALYCAHEAKHPDGATAFKSEETQFGLSMTKLWGADQGSAFGYYLNDTMALSLKDEIKENDRILAFCYTDLESFSDTYSYFDKSHPITEENQSLSLTLSTISFDADFNLVSLPLENADVLINGEKTQYKTDKNGQFTITMDKAGEYKISAEKSDMTLISPISILTVEAPKKAPVTGDLGTVFFVIAVLSAATALTLKKNEK